MSPTFSRGNGYFKQLLSSKDRNSESKQTRVVALVLCTSPHGALHLCDIYIYVKFHENISSGFQLTERT